MRYVDLYDSTSPNLHNLDACKMLPWGMRSPWCPWRSSAGRRGTICRACKSWFPAICAAELKQHRGHHGLAIAEGKNASLPSDLFVDSGVWGPLMDEQPHYLGISFPGCQVQRVTAFGISHIGQRIVPQKNLNHIPRRQKSIMSLQNSEGYPTYSASHLGSWSPFRYYLIRAPLSLPELIAQSLPFIPWATCTAVDRRLKHLEPNDTDSSPCHSLGFLDNPSLFHYFENVWFPCLNLTMLPCLWCLNSIWG